MIKWEFWRWVGYLGEPGCFRREEMAEAGYGFEVEDSSDRNSKTTSRAAEEENMEQRLSCLGGHVMKVRSELMIHVLCTGSYLVVQLHVL